VSPLLTQDEDATVVEGVGQETRVAVVGNVTVSTPQRLRLPIPLPPPPLCTLELEIYPFFTLLLLCTCIIRPKT